MNNYEIAKEWINSLEDDWSKVDIEWEAVDEIRELVDRATPRKDNSLACPSCGELNTVLFEYDTFEDITCFNFCPDCGQAIDWSEE